MSNYHELDDSSEYLDLQMSKYHELIDSSENHVLDESTCLIITTKWESFWAGSKHKSQT